MKCCSSSLPPSRLHSQSPDDGLVILLASFLDFLVPVLGRLYMLASALREERGRVGGASTPCLTLVFSIGFTVGCAELV